MRYQQAGALPETPPHREAGDQPYPLQLSHPVLAPSERAEAEAGDLAGSENLVLEQEEQDLVVSLVDRALARARYVSFCSSHDSGTALPPPSVRGLRRGGPVTCGFALPRPAPSRRPRAAAHGRWGSATPRQGACANTAGSTDLQFVPVLTSLLAGHHASSGRRPNSPSAIRHGAPSRISAVAGRRSGPVRSPSERSPGRPFTPSAPHS